jgi:hypothetical protein
MSSGLRFGGSSGAGARIALNRFEIQKLHVPNSKRKLNECS